MTQTTGSIARTIHETLQEAKLAVMRDVHYIQKSSSPNLKYTFASEAELVKRLRDAMIEHGITMAPVEGKHISTDVSETKTGGKMRTGIIERTFRFSHVDSEDTNDVHVFGEAGDMGDKMMGKAMTHAKKYALREYFLVETGDDPDEQVYEMEGKRKMNDLYQRASQAIFSASDKSALNKAMAYVNDPKNGFSEAQIAILNNLRTGREQQLKEIESGSPTENN